MIEEEGSEFYYPSREGNKDGDVYDDFFEGSKYFGDGKKLE